MPHNKTSGNGKTFLNSPRQSRGFLEIKKKKQLLKKNDNNAGRTKNYYFCLPLLRSTLADLHDIVGGFSTPRFRHSVCSSCRRNNKGGSIHEDGRPTAA
jgi:hypothetical protein